MLLKGSRSHRGEGRGEEGRKRPCLRSLREAAPLSISRSSEGSGTRKKRASPIVPEGGKREKGPFAGDTALRELKGKKGLDLRHRVLNGKKEKGGAQLSGFGGEKMLTIGKPDLLMRGGKHCLSRLFRFVPLIRKRETRVAFVLGRKDSEEEGEEGGQRDAYSPQPEKKTERGVLAHQLGASEKRGGFRTSFGRPEKGKRKSARSHGLFWEGKERGEKGSNPLSITRSRGRREKKEKFLLAR